MVLKVIHTNTVCILPSFPDFPTPAFDCLRDVMLDGGNEANCVWLVKTTILSYKLHPSQRGRVWSCCNHQVVSMECNDLTQWSDNKMLTSAKHVLIVLHDTDASYEEHRSDWSHRGSAMVTS